MEVIPGLTVESDITLIGQGCRIKGSLVCDRFTRIHGEVHGNIIGLKDSFIVIGETGSVHGEIQCDEITIDGFVRGDIKSTARVTISESGRLIGNVIAPDFAVKFGAHFEGRAITTREQPAPEATPQLSNA